MNYIKRVMLIFVATVGILIFCTTLSLATVTGKITKDGVRLRQKPSTDSTIITNLYTDEEVEVIKKENEWYSVKYKDNEGYVHGDYLKLTEELVEPTEIIEQPSEPENESETKQEEYPKQMKLKENTNLYIMPSISSSQIDNMKANIEISVIKVINNWSYVEYEKKLGWVRNYYLIEINEDVKQTAEVAVPQVENNNVEQKIMYILASAANLRKTPSLEADVLTVLYRNTEIVLVNQENDWCKIKYNNYEGYISKELISDTKTEITSRSNVRTEPTNAIEQNTKQEDTVIKTVYISVNVANIRAEANTNSNVITKLNKKKAIEVIGTEGNFYKVKINDITGYIANWIVTDDLSSISVDNPVLTTQVTPETPNNVNQIAEISSENSGSQIVEYAKQFLGYKYVYGGASPSGFDCSGFTSYVYKQCGVSINRTATAQTNNGVAVSKDNLIAGDLVFFGYYGNNSISHVGIYIGSGDFIHASNSTRGVVIDTVNSGYYCTNYITARRIV